MFDQVSSICVCTQGNIINLYKTPRSETNLYACIRVYRDVYSRIFSIYTDNNILIGVSFKFQVDSMKTWFDKFKLDIVYLTRDGVLVGRVFIR